MTTAAADLGDTFAARENPMTSRISVQIEKRSTDWRKACSAALLRGTRNPRLECSMSPSAVGSAVAFFSSTGMKIRDPRTPGRNAWVVSPRDWRNDRSHPKDLNEPQKTAATSSEKIVGVASAMAL